MRVLFFGTYEKWRYPRVQVLIEGFRAHGDDVRECNAPLGLDTDARMALLRQPWRAPVFLVRLLRAWYSLWRRARAEAEPDAVIVPYMGHFDIHLARALWPRTPTALDHLISAAGTARDRRLAIAPIRRALEMADGLAVAKADVPFVDTDENLRALSRDAVGRALVVPVGAPGGYFVEVEAGDPIASRLRVGFFGIYTPLHGARTIGAAIAALGDEPIDFVMVGSGQERDETRRIAAANDNVRWIDWLTLGELREEIRGWDVALGIFGTTPKALSVVPHKVYLGAASGRAIVTSDTPPQRRAMASAAVYVAPGDADRLAATLSSLAREPERVRRLQEAAAGRARARFHPDAVVEPLRARLAELAEAGAVGRG